MLCAVLGLTSLRGLLALEPDGAQTGSNERKPPAPVKRRFTISKETTYITEPLTADGFPNYVEVLNRRAAQGVAPEKNGVVLLWQAVGPQAVPGKISAEYFRRLGVAPPPASGKYFINFSDFIKDVGNPKWNPDKENVLWEQLWNAQKRPWTARQYPRVAGWLAANDRPLALAVRMSRRAHWYSPLVAPGDGRHFALTDSGFVYVPMRLLAMALRARSMLRLGERDNERAWQDIITTNRLGALFARGPTLRDGLVGFTNYETAANCVASYAHFARPTSEQSALLRRELAEMGSRIRIDAVHMESLRFDVLDNCAFATRIRKYWNFHPLNFHIGGRVKVPTWYWCAVIEWDEILRACNRGCDDLADILKIADWQKRRRELRRLSQHHESALRDVLHSMPSLAAIALMGPAGRQIVSYQLGKCEMARFLPSASSALRAEDRHRTWEIQLDMVLALAAYRSDHGGYPATLDELVPDYCKELPRDRSTGAAFRYQRTDNGFRLYSLGVNGVDDTDNRLGDDLTSEVPVPATKRRS